MTEELRPETHRRTSCRTAAMLSLLMLVDIVTPCTVGAVCDAHKKQEKSCTGFGLFYFIKNIWPGPYHFGESSLDLVLTALARCLAFILLAVLRLNRRGQSDAQLQPMLQPLNASVTPTLGSDTTAVVPTRAPRLLSAKGAAWSTWTVTAATWSYASAKGVARLLQSGDRADGDGLGVLPTPTTPPELEFWLCILAAYILSDLERRAFNRTFNRSKAANREEDGVGAGSVVGESGSRKSSAEAAADAAQEMKKQYVRQTEPKRVRVVRTMLRLMAPDAHLLLLAYTSLIIAAAGESAVPWLYGLVIDAIAINPQPKKLQWYILALIGTALVTGIFTGLRGSTFIVLGGRFGKRLRTRLFESLLTQELDFFGATKTGDVTSRLSADCQKVSDQVQLNVNVFLRSFIQVVFTLSLMIWLNLKLALASFVIVPAIVGISKVFSDYMQVLSTETQDTLADANATAEEVIGSIATTRAFAAQSEEIRRYDEGMGKYLGTVVRQARLYFVYSSLTFTFLPYLTYCLILFFAAQLIHTPEGCTNTPTHGPSPPSLGLYEPQSAPAPPLHDAPRCGIDGPSLVSFVFYMQSLFAAFQSLGNIYTALAQAIGAADKVLKWIHRRPTIMPPTDPVTPPSCLGDLKIVDVHFTYQLRPERPVLTGLSLHAAPGEVVALCGPSGGGKSSIISLLERFYVPDSGEVLLDGVPIEKLSPAWFHRQVALVGQEPTLFARSLRDNICYGLLQADQQPSFDEIVRAATLANAHDFISAQEHGYETYIGERGTQLSGGQKQRVAIARALVRKPAVLLLDEATSALDAESEHVVQEAIDTMIAQGGMTVLVIAHRLSTIRNADRILVVKQGRIAESGTHSELLARADGEYAKLVNRQMHSESRINSRPNSQLPSQQASSLDLASLQTPSAAFAPPPAFSPLADSAKGSATDINTAAVQSG